MRLSQVLLTVVLVAGGIFVYDALLARPPEEAPPADLHAASPPAAEPAPALPPFAVLEGRGDDLWRADVERRLAELERRGNGATTTEAGSLDEPASSSDAPDEEAPADGESAEDGAPARERRPVTHEEVARFRALLEAVERQRREEDVRRKMREGLKKIGVELTEPQTKSVVDLTLRFYRGVQQKLQTIPQGEETRDQRLALYQQMKRDYADELYGIIPAAEADRIMQAIQSREQPAK